MTYGNLHVKMMHVVQISETTNTLQTLEVLDSNDKSAITLA